MAENFRTQVRNHSTTRICISLFGDFDGASAYKLADVVKEHVGKTKQIDIETDGLKDIYHFGLYIFNGQIKKLRTPSTAIEFKGRYNETFIQ